jgi:hypothetical protein
VRRKADRLVTKFRWQHHLDGFAEGEGRARVVAEPEMAWTRVGAAGSCHGDGVTAEALGHSEDARDLDGTRPEGRVGTDHAGSHRADDHLGALFSDRERER